MRKHAKYAWERTGSGQAGYGLRIHREEHRVPDVAIARGQIREHGYVCCFCLLTGPK